MVRRFAVIRKEKTDTLKSLFWLYKMYNESNTEISPTDFLFDGAQLRYVKYAAGDQVYKILSSDALFAFHSELSNDWSENKFLSDLERNDVYMTCFYCDNLKKKPGDVYSQWTSYCASGGSAIEFYFGQNIVFNALNMKSLNEDDFIRKVSDLVDGKIANSQNLFNYSIMATEDNDSSDYILYPLFPFPVSYSQPDDNSNNFSLNDTNISTLKCCIDIINHSKYGYDPIDLSHFAPYIKHYGFHQEQEVRLAFVNRNNSLSKCVRFLGEKKVPYIFVKFGNRDDNLHPCNMLDGYKGDTLEEKAKSYFDSLNNILCKNSSVPIIIPQGRDQEEVYNAIEKQVIEHNKKNKFDQRISIVCQGHLPITKITLAPTHDKELQKKKLEIFCKSKYWLRNVEICTSTLPYNMVNINHT